MNTRLLGTLGMIAAPLALIENAVFGFGARESNGLFTLLGMLYMLGWLCSCAGLWRLNATGTGPVGRGILALMMIGLILGAIDNLLLAVAPNLNRDTLILTVTDLAWPLSHVYILIVGIAALTARRLAGWQRWGPFLVGLAVPITLVIQLLLGLTGLDAPAEYFAIIPALLLLLLGYAVRTAGDPDRTGAPSVAQSSAV